MLILQLIQTKADFYVKQVMCRDHLGYVGVIEK